MLQWEAQSGRVEGQVGSKGGDCRVPTVDGKVCVFEIAERSQIDYYAGSQYCLSLAGLVGLTFVVKQHADKVIGQGEQKEHHPVNGDPAHIKVVA